MDLILQSNNYFYFQGILNANWRKGDSIWSLVTYEILSKVLKKANKMNNAGELEAYMKQHDQKRETSGQVTFSISKK